MTAARKTAQEGNTAIRIVRSILRNQLAVFDRGEGHEDSAVKCLGEKADGAVGQEGIGAIAVKAGEGAAADDARIVVGLPDAFIEIGNASGGEGRGGGVA